MGYRINPNTICCPTERQGVLRDKTRVYPAEFFAEDETVDLVKRGFLIEEKEPVPVEEKRGKK